MTSDVIKPGSPFDAIKHEDEKGEYWFARDLMPLLGYAQWRQFNDAINRARASAAVADVPVHQHFIFADARKNAGQVGRLGGDFRLSRYACYLVAMNGDTRKREIADAQQYFVVKTRQAEVIEQQAALPGTYLDALKALVTEVEAKERAELLAAEKAAEVEMLTPPAEAWQTLADTGQDYSVREAAYILKRDAAISDRVGPRRLFEWIVDRGMAQRKADGQYVPYAAHSDHLRLKAQSRPDHESGGFKEAHSQLRVTVKGLAWIQQRMRDEGRPDLLGIGARTPTPPSTLPPAMEHSGEGEVVDIHSVRTALMRR